MLANVLFVVLWCSVFSIFFPRDNNLKGTAPGVRNSAASYLGSLPAAWK